MSDQKRRKVEKARAEAPVSSDDSDASSAASNAGDAEVEDGDQTSSPQSFKDLGLIDSMLLNLGLG